jgi:1-acyl-sn-glycerol-3-phosphate acyltransferase
MIETPCIAIFPEGTRSADGKPGPARDGIIKLAMRLDRPIVPVILSGFYTAWPRHRRFPGISRCAITYCAPMLASRESDPQAIMKVIGATPEAT